MSDSELSEASHTPVPPDNEIEESLRREVSRATKAGDDVTLRKARTASEKKLGLPDGFYKGHETWKDKSKDIVQDQLDHELELPSSPVATKKGGDAAKTKQPASKAAKRQSNEANGRSRKKQKTQSEQSSEELSSPLSEMDSASEPETKPQKIKKAQKPAVKISPAGKKQAKSKPEPVKPEMEEEEDAGAGGEKSDSELSVLIDDEPQPKKKGKRRDSQDSKPKKAKATKAKAPADENPDQAEIKRLQSWLVKCGIRKLWGKELKPYETPKAKIKHLKDMLSEVGMTGRYSQEKANQIKEARELAADIEAVQEGEERWGKGDEEAADEGERPQKRLVRGAKNYDFLSSDGEETD